MKKIVLIDGNSILNRAFYGLPDMTNSKGIHTNAILGFLNIMFKILDEEKPEKLIVAFDMKAKTFRHDIFPDYKGTRKKMPDELSMQMPLIKKVLKSMNILILEKEGFEADDIIGTCAYMAQDEDYEVSVISGDRDLLQLATKKIKIRIPKTKRQVTEIEDYYEDDVKEKYFVTPTEFIDLKALMGDSSDNIPGVPGIGEKTATNIITEFSSIENAYENYLNIKPVKAGERLRDNYELAKLCKVLATIDVHVSLDIKLDDARIDDIFNENAYIELKDLELNSVLKRFDLTVSKKQTEFDLEIDIVTDFKKLTVLKNNILDLSNNASQKDFFVSISYYSLPVKQQEKQLTLFFEDSSVDSNNDSHDTLLALSINESKSFILSTKHLLDSQIKDFIHSLFVKGVNFFVSGIKTFINDFLVNKLDIDYIKDNNLLLDTNLLAYLINPTRDLYTYDSLAKEFLDKSIASKEELLKKTHYEVALYDKFEDFLKLLAYEANIYYQLRKVMLDKIEELEMSSLLFDIELPLTYALLEMENIGIMCDKSALKEFSDKLGISIRQLEIDIFKEVGEEFNLNSPKQLGEILFEKLSIPNGKKTKTGYSTAADVLEKLAPEYPIINKILEYRQLTKLKSTYADGLSNYIKEDNRIHGTFNQTITATGRISSTDPNLQNIPIRTELGREIRKVFVAKQGCTFIDADYSQIELRVLAHMSEDINLIEAYKEELDIHKITASKVFKVPLNEVTSTQRSNAKAVNFGIVYGISAFGLSQDLSISRKEADTYIKEYFKSYPGIKEFLDNTVSFAKEHGYVKTIFNRLRPIPELSSSNFMQRAFGERIAMNSPIQGSAADIIKIAMIRVNERLKKENLKSKIVLQIHDELLIEAYDEEVESVKELLLDEMMGAAKLSVPLNIGMSQGKNWFEAH